MEAVVEEESVFEQSQMSMIKSEDGGYRGTELTQSATQSNNNNATAKSRAFFLDEREQDDYDSLEEDDDHYDYEDEYARGTTMKCLADSDYNSYMPGFITA